MKKFILLLTILMAPALALADAQVKWSVLTPEGTTVITDYNMTDETWQRIIDYVWNLHPQPGERGPDTEYDALRDWQEATLTSVKGEVFEYELIQCGIEPMPDSL